MFFQNTNWKNARTQMALFAAILLTLTSCEKESLEKNCQPVEIKGKLTHNPSAQSYQYKTTGGWIVDIKLTDKISFSHPNYPGNSLELFGGGGGNMLAGSQEFFNGVHIKNRQGSRRSIILPDGTKLTMAAPGIDGGLKWVSIFEGNESHRINTICGVEHSSLDFAEAQVLDNNEADGETAGLLITTVFFQFMDLYSEKTLTDKILNRKRLAEARFANPTEVTDEYDDPNLPDT